MKGLFCYKSCFFIKNTLIYFLPFEEAYITP